MPKRGSHFFALRPAPGAVAELGQARDRPGLGGSKVADDHLHATLFWLGYDHPGTPAVVAAAAHAAGTIRAKPFRIVFDRLVAAENSLLVLPSDTLDHLHAFQNQLATALARCGVQADRGWRFSPHVTLRRGPSGGGAGAIDPVAWTTTNFVLVRSVPDPLRHETVGRWPLRAGG